MYCEAEKREPKQTLSTDYFPDKSEIKLTFIQQSHSNMLPQTSDRIHNIYKAVTQIRPDYTQDKTVSHFSFLIPSTKKHVRPNCKYEVLEMIFYLPVLGLGRCNSEMLVGRC